MTIIWEDDISALLDLGEQVPLLEFRSEHNSIGPDEVNAIREALDAIERGDWRGLVIGSRATHFSLGIHLGQLSTAVTQRRFRDIERTLERFQAALQRLRYSPKPVVVATHGRALGGGCELAMASPHPVAAARTRMGLVEFRVGLIPAGTGSMRMAAWADDKAPSSRPGDILPFLQSTFEAIVLTRVSRDPSHAQEMGYLSPLATIVSDIERRLYVARGTVVHLSETGYYPPARGPVRVLGRPAMTALEDAMSELVEQRKIGGYDKFLARRLAHVLTGGDLRGPSEVDEDYLLGLEREMLLSVLGEKRTIERITGLLETGRPIRN